MSLLKVNAVTDLGGDTPIIPAYPGQILQVVFASRDTAFTMNSTSFVDVTDMSITITPSSASSKFLVSVHANMEIITGNNANSQLRIARNGSLVGKEVNQSVLNNAAVTSARQNATIFVLDSPATTSTVTYTAQVQRSSETLQVTTGRITVMEVAG